MVARLQAQAKGPADAQVVEISGEVRLPGQYPLLSDRSVDALVSMAGGYETSAYLETAEITRISFTAQGAAKVSTFSVSLTQPRHAGGAQLAPLDRVRISQMPNWTYGDAVEVTGAVAFPGSFPILPGEMLSSVLARAGGVSENGFPKARY